jgi:hypothetical protein
MKNDNDIALLKAKAQLILRQESQWGGMHKSISMVDNTWNTFFLC